MKKKILRICCITMLSLLLTSCVSHNNSAGDDSITTNSNQNFPESNTTNTNISLQNDNAIPINIHTPTALSYYFDSNYELNALTITDQVNNSSYIACNIPGCTHTTSPCPSIEYSILPYLNFTSDNHILFMDGKSNKVYIIDVSGDNLKELVDFSNYDTFTQSDAIVVNSHVYTAISCSTSTIDENGFVSIINSTAKLLDIDMKKGTVSILYESDSFPNLHLNNLFFNNDKLYFSYQAQTKSFDEIGISYSDYYSNYDKYFNDRYTLQGLKDNLIIFDISSKQYTLIDWLDISDPGYVPNGVANNKIYWFDDNGIYYYSQENKTKQTLFSDPNCTYYYIYQSADFIMYRYKENNIFKYFIIYEGMDVPLPMTNTSHLDFYILDECYEKLHIQYYNADTEGEFDAKNSEYISRNEFKSWFK